MTPPTATTDGHIIVCSVIATSSSASPVMTTQVPSVPK